MRRPAARDADALFAIYGDARVMRYWSRPPFARRGEAVRMLQAMSRGAKDGSWRSWVVTRAGDKAGGAIGVCSLFHFVESCRRAEIGYILARAQWGKGIMSEALAAVIAHAFGAPPAGLGLRRLEADADPRNAASIRLLTRLGFVREGTLRERWEVAGEISDAAFYGLLARDWRAAQAPSPPAPPPARSRR